MYERQFENSEFKYNILSCINVLLGFELHYITYQNFVPLCCHEYNENYDRKRNITYTEIGF